MKVYYTIAKQLENVDGFEETNGYKDINVYLIYESELKRIMSYECENSYSTEGDILERLAEENVINEDDTVELILL